MGRTMLAIRENELATACLGIKVARTRVFAFALGAFFASIAGRAVGACGDADQP